MSDRRVPPAADEWGTFEDARRRKFTMALALTHAERLAWLERAIELARQAGALPRLRPAPPE